MRLSSQRPPATNRLSPPKYFVSILLHTLLRSPKRNPFLFNPFRTLRQKTRGWRYPHSSCNSTFLLMPDRLQNRFYLRGIHFDGHRTQDKFERKDHPKYALPPHQDSLYALKRSS